MEKIDKTVSKSEYISPSFSVIELEPCALLMESNGFYIDPIPIP